MTATPETLAWVARAEEDYVLARSSMRRKKPLTYGASFHAQQCAEKYLKATLIERGHITTWLLRIRFYYTACSRNVRSITFTTRAKAWLSSPACRTIWSGISHLPGVNEQ